ncbi:MAG: UDP-N-acetylmuramoyl-L-alanyl-D-glutamate--2,6-diaminopimelate ligase [Proteobacteria bacterium]|nr:UDP-N-acetylmuramoyl-L-alanyl-D-glutamate--2,6-diaminopimelate ligase [Pseudomonadota bacterium]
MSEPFEVKEQGRIIGDWVCTIPGTAVSFSEGIALSSLFADLDNHHLLTGNPATCLISQVTTDSRKATAGSLFIALVGSQHDGHTFISQAGNRKCSAFLVEKGRVGLDSYGDEACVIEVDNTRMAYAAIAETLFAHPARQMDMVAITGTNGKTTVSYLLESVLHQAGKQPGVLGTINYRYLTRQGEMVVVPSSFTTPEPLLLQETLRRMADSGVDTVVMEVSSHGLEQQRIGTLSFDVAAFTNLSRDHLDYHQDMDAYFAAKSLLFTKHLRKGGRAVVTMGDAGGEKYFWGNRLRQICEEQGLSVLCCGAASGDIYPLEVTGDLAGTRIRLRTPAGDRDISSPLVGDFNVANIQTTFAVALTLGIEPLSICNALSSAVGAPGRLQRMVTCTREQTFLPSVFVDYAHTPDALEQVLKTVKALPHRTLYCVFGCGGDRDAGKRPLMGGIAGKYSDIAIVTDDNPRSEVSSAILSAIVAGMRISGLAEQAIPWLQEKEEGEQGFVLIPDRAQAIHATIAAAGKGDIVLIAGKGHEQYQLTSEGKKFFDDSLEAAEALSRWRLESLIQATEGYLLGRRETAIIPGSLSTDSRKIGKGDIFVALRGERFDGHDFVKQVVAAGAGCLVLEQEPEEPLSVPALIVKNTERALGDLAAYRRNCMKEISRPIVAAITGSSGKTTVKEMCAAIFAERWPDGADVARGRVLKTEGNFNNLIGLPLSLLPVTPRHQAVILEMGMNAPGEIARLTEIADPDIACIVNVHGAHLQGLGDIDGVARAKGELFQGCGKDSVLVVNSDDPRVVAAARGCKQKKIFYGMDPKQHAFPLKVWSSVQETSEREEIPFTLHILKEEARVVLQVPGIHNIANGLAAAAIAHAAGIDLSTIAKGLSAFVPADRRMQILNGPAGSRLINDTYNANPASMRAGISTLCQLGSGEHIAILGDMLELGAGSESLHREIGAYAAASGVDFLGLVGDFAHVVAAGAEEQGMAPGRVKVFSSKKECLSWIQELVLRGCVHSGTYILVKGSRGMRLETLIEQLQSE